MNLPLDPPKAPRTVTVAFFAEAAPKTDRTARDWLEAAIRWGTMASRVAREIIDWLSTLQLLPRRLNTSKNRPGGVA